MLPKIDSYFTKANLNKEDKIQQKFDYTLNFDGCSKSNPGLAGAGAVLYYYDNEIWSESLFVGEKITNNYAEYSGLILGLQKAKEMGIKVLRVQGDSLLVINQMLNIYKCKSLNLIELYDKAKELEDSFEKVYYNHVFRNENKRADELSNIAIQNYLKDNDVIIYGGKILDIIK